MSRNKQLFFFIALVSIVVSVYILSGWSNKKMERRDEILIGELIGDIPIGSSLDVIKVYLENKGIKYNIESFEESSWGEQDLINKTYASQLFFSIPANRSLFQYSLGAKYIQIEIKLDNKNHMISYSGRYVFNSF